MVKKLQELLENRRFADVHKMLESVNSADIPSIFDELEEEQIVVVYRLLSKDVAAEVFVELDSDMQEKLINAFTDKELKNVIDELFMDDTVDLIEEMPANVVKRILKTQKAEDRKLINDLLKYPEDSAGSIMTTEFVDLKENMTVKDAIDKIRKIGDDAESIYVCYVLTMTRKLIGIVSLKDIILAKENTLVKDIMDTNFIKVFTMDEQEDVAKKFDKYDEIAMPVVDNEDRLVGIVTVDDAMDVMHEEMDEDFEIMAAMSPSEDTYFKTSVFKHARNRIFWLLVLMISATITGGVITKYENAFEALPLLVAFLPMVMGTGGNCGSQSSTLIIRGLANDEIKLKDFFRAWWEEVRVAFLVGIALFIANSIRILIQYKDIKLAIIVGCTLMGTVTIAKSLGCILPMIAKKFKLDPAIMAAPLISTILDTCSVFIYFNIATLVMGL